MGASAAAAIIIRKEKDLVAHFRAAGATSAGSAKSVTALGVDQHVAWRILEGKEIIREASPGTFYLDEERWEASVQRRRKIAMFMLAALAAFSAAVAAGLLRTTR
jgi:hypothetical protein